MSIVRRMSGQEDVFSDLSPEIQEALGSISFASKLEAARLARSEVLKSRAAADAPSTNPPESAIVVREFELHPANDGVIVDGGVLAMDGYDARPPSSEGAEIPDKVRFRAPTLVAATLAATMAAGAVGIGSEGTASVDEAATAAKVIPAEAALPSVPDLALPKTSDPVIATAARPTTTQPDREPQVSQAAEPFHRTVAGTPANSQARYVGFSPGFILAIESLAAGKDGNKPEFGPSPLTLRPTFASMVNDFDKTTPLQKQRNDNLWSATPAAVQVMAEAGFEIPVVPPGKQFGTGNTPIVIERLVSVPDASSESDAPDAESGVMVAALSPTIVFEVSAFDETPTEVMRLNPTIAPTNKPDPVGTRTGPDQLVMREPVSVGRQSTLSIAAADASRPTNLDNDPSVIVPMPDWPYDLRLFVPNKASDDLVEPIVASMIKSGFVPSKESRVAFRISESHVRFYHSIDRDRAEELAATFGGEARDFGSTRKKPDPGTLEVWLAGSGKGERRTAAAKKSKKVARGPLRTFQQFKRNSERDIKLSIQQIRKVPGALREKINGMSAK